MTTAGLSFINDLRPVTFNWKKEKDIPEEMKAHKAVLKNDTITINSIMVLLHKKSKKQLIIIQK